MFSAVILGTDLVYAFAVGLYRGGRCGRCRLEVFVESLFKHWGTRLFVAAHRSVRPCSDQLLRRHLRGESQMISGTFDTRRMLAASMLVAAGLLGACSANLEVGKTAGTPKDVLAKTVKEKLEAHAGKKADSVTCDGDLEAKVGATQKCVLTVGGSKLGVTVTATSVNGDNIKFDAKVDDKLMP